VVEVIADVIGCNASAEALTQPPQRWAKGVVVELDGG
jgi:hypothetical protein